MAVYLHWGLIAGVKLFVEPALFHHLSAIVSHKATLRQYKHAYQ